MPNSYPRDEILNLHLTTIKDSYILWSMMMSKKCHNQRSLSILQNQLVQDKQDTLLLKAENHVFAQTSHDRLFDGQNAEFSFFTYLSIQDRGIPMHRRLKFYAVTHNNPKNPEYLIAIS